jgi:subtilisin family serine protease/uncharacterized protein YjdB
MKKITKSTLSLAMAVALGVSGMPTLGTDTVKVSAATDKTKEKSKKETKNLLGTDLTKSKKERYKAGQALVMYRNTTANVKKFSKKDVFGSTIKVEKSCTFQEQTKAEQKKVSAQKLTGKNGYTVSLVTSTKYNTAELLSMLKRDSDVLYVQPNYICKAEDAADFTSYQWALDNQGQNNGTKDVDNGIKKVDSSKYSKEEKVVAIIDTGVDYTHDDLKNIMWNNPYTGELKGAHGYDFANADADPLDDNGHGSHCAGIIAGDSTNQSGISGVASGNVKVMALKFLDEDGYGDTFSAISAYNYIYTAQTLGTNVVAVNNSWGGEIDYEYGDAILEQVINMVGEKGAISVCAASNEANDNDANHNVSPACLDSKYILSVAAANEKGELASFSNYGANSVDIAAPGADILSSVSYNNFEPALYKDVENYCDYYLDFTQKVKECEKDALGTVDISDKNTLCYAMDNNGDGKVSVEVSDEEYLSAANGNKNSLKWTIKGAKEGEEYTLYFPYEREVSLTPYHQTFHLRSNAPKMDMEKYMKELFYQGSTLVVSDSKVASGGAIDEDLIGGLSLDGDANYWNQIEYTRESSISKKKAGRYAYGISVQVSDDGDFTFYLDELGFSKADVKEDSFGKYAYYNGTSMAAPQVAGGIAVAKSLYPNDSAWETKERVVNSAKQVEALKGKVASNGMMDLSNLANPKPAVSDASIDEDGTVRVEGKFFGSNPTVTVNGEKVSISQKDDNFVSFKAEKNKLLRVTISNDKGLVEQEYFFAEGKESKKVAYAVNHGTEVNAVSDGDNLYLVGTDGSLLKYAVQEPASYVDTVTDSGIKVPMLTENACTDEFDIVDIFGEDKKTLVNYSLTTVSQPVSCGKELYTIVSLDMGYASTMALVHFNEEKGTWEKAADLPKNYKKVRAMSLASYEDKLYMIGGYDIEKEQTITDVTCFDPEQKEWKSVSSMPEGKFNAQALQTNGKLVVTLGGTGEKSTKGSNKTFIFDGEKWTQGAELPTLYGRGDAEEVEISYADSLTNDENTVVVATSKTAYRVLNYYKAAVGVTDAGLIYTGLNAEGLGNTYYYDVASNQYISAAVNHTTLNAEDKVTGATVNDKFYAFSGQTWEIEDDSMFALGKSNTVGKLDKTKDDFGTTKDEQQYIYLVSGIDVTYTPVKVKQEKTYEEGYISGAGNYTVNEKATIKAIPYEGCFVKALYVDGKKVENGYTFQVTEKGAVVKAEFGKYVTLILLDEQEQISAGGTLKLNSSVMPFDADNQKLTWKSSDESVATVDQDGVVKAKEDAEGKSVTITATAADCNTITAKCTITVTEKQSVKPPKKVAVKKIKLSATKKTVKAGKTLKIKAVITPANATNKKLTWKSNKKKYATVNSKGIVKAKKAGKGHTVKITATSVSKPKVKGTIKIKIK